MIIELMLDRFFEGAKSGQTKFSFYANDFGCSEEYTPIEAKGKC